MIQAYCRLLAGWMAKSGFKRRLPDLDHAAGIRAAIGRIAQAGREAFAGWGAVIARALVRDGFSKAEARRLSTLAVSAIEGALILARVEAALRRSTMSQNRLRASCKLMPRRGSGRA